FAGSALLLLFFLLLIPPPPRSTLFPYTTLFRSYEFGGAGRFGFDPRTHRSESSSLLTPENVARLHACWHTHWDSTKTIFVLSQRSEEHTSELQSLRHLVCRLLLEKKKINKHTT